MLIFHITNTFGQEISVKVDTVNGIVFSKYLKSHNEYCASGTYLIYKGDTLPFFERTITNEVFIKHFDEARIALTADKSITRFSNLETSRQKDKSYDLTMSEYSFHSRDIFKRPIVTSPQFFYALDSSEIYTVYNFFGEVALYYGICPYSFINIDDCAKASTDLSKNRFAILNKAWNQEPLTDKQIKSHNLKQCGIFGIYIFYSE